MDITHTYPCLCDTLELLLDSLKSKQKKKKKGPCHAVWMNTSWLQVCVSVTLPHRGWGSCQIIVFCTIFLPSSSSLPLHLSFRNADDPEVSLQLQCQLHRPPHLSVHALTTEDGPGTPESPAGEPRGHRNKHGYIHWRKFSGKIWGSQVQPKSWLIAARTCMIFI